MDQKNGTIWAMFYSGLIAFAMHPANRKGCPPYELSDYALDQNARIADQMLIRYRARYGTSYTDELTRNSGLGTIAGVID